MVPEALVKEWKNDTEHLSTTARMAKHPAYRESFTMPPTNPPRNLDEIAALGGNIFDRQVRPALRPADDGKFVAIDVGTGDYEMDEDDYAAVARLRVRKPAADIWLMRVGSPTTYRMGLLR